MNCPKCGGTPKISWMWRRIFVAPFDICQNGTEHLHYHCACGYSWDGPTLDQQQPTADDERGEDQAAIEAQRGLKG